MAGEANVITEFLKKPFGKLGIISLLLYIFEENIDDDFVCPCERVQNIVTSLIYGGIPSVSSFFITYGVMDFFPETDDKKQMDITKKNKKLYSILTSAVWLFLCLIDGRYLSCATSASKGEYTETDTLKWCKPSGNTTFFSEDEQTTQKWMSISQDMGFCMLVIVFLLVAGFKKFYNTDTNTNTVEMEIL
ncbi:hypothetical protein PGIGA_G00172240 [Pangasianodon gigas]|uniref:Uncharacterized protein n=1 Tax=Pangasianodon gigas TaxID=30993 RepID=A0ACC5XTU6_PANGG|nr:hypothetical protein [Pangasianodon gigas]